MIDCWIVEFAWQSNLCLRNAVYYIQTNWLRVSYTTSKLIHGLDDENVEYQADSGKRLKSYHLFVRSLCWLSVSVVVVIVVIVVVTVVVVALVSVEVISVVVTTRWFKPKCLRSVNLKHEEDFSSPSYSSPLATDYCFRWPWACRLSAPTVACHFRIVGCKINATLTNTATNTGHLVKIKTFILLLHIRHAQHTCTLLTNSNSGMVDGICNMQFVVFGLQFV